jgi:hypothetical protein
MDDLIAKRREKSGKILNEREKGGIDWETGDCTISANNTKKTTRMYFFVKKKKEHDWVNEWMNECLWERASDEWIHKQTISI